MKLFGGMAAIGVMTGASCFDGLTGPASTPNADGTYKGDFQVVSSYYAQGPSGLTLKGVTITGAVGFTVQGNKVITTPAAGEGTATWDDVNKYMWIEFESIVSSNESHCSKWRYAGVLQQSNNFASIEGTISCRQPDQVFSAFAQGTSWKATRQ